jgi:uncharacterized UBP type Zn finger protein
VHAERISRNNSGGNRTQRHRINGDLRASSGSSSSSSSSSSRNNVGNNNWVDGEHRAESDGNNDSEYDSTCIAATNTSDDLSTHYHGENGFESDEPSDLWVCLVCGFIGCGSSHCNHIRDHYERHLHAYAMNTGDVLHNA